MKKIETLCLIDDDSSFQFLTQKIIESTGLVKRFRIFSNGRSAIQYIESAIRLEDDLPDVIFLDLNMPVMDGWEFLDEYIRLSPQLIKKITIYIITSSIDSSDAERSRAFSEVSDFIIKPVTRKKFMEMIEKMET